MKKKCFLCLLILLSSLHVSLLHAFSDSFLHDGICYRPIDSKKAMVCWVAESELGTRKCIIPATVTDGTVTYFVTSIGESAFRNCFGLTSVTIPEGVTDIGKYAFRGCSSLTSVTIPESVTSIGESAFRGCSSLTSVTIPESVTRIDECAFGNCPELTSVMLNSNAIVSEKEILDVFGSQVKECILGKGVTSIGVSAFFGCSGLSSVTIPESVTSIGESAFRGCSSLSSVTIPESVTSIGEYAFSDCSGLTSVTISESVTSIGEYAFWDCSGLSSVAIPESVTSIGRAAFLNCSGLSSVTIPESVTSIGEYAFSYCSGLTSVTIPESVTSIGEYAFYGCSGLTSVTSLNPMPPSTGGGGFYHCDSDAILHVLNGCKDVYQTSNWGEYFSIIIDDAVSSKQLLSEKREEALKTCESALKIYEAYMSYYDGDGMEHYKQVSEKQDANSKAADSVLDDIEQLEKKLSECGMTDEDIAPYVETVNAVKEDVTALKGESSNIFAANSFHDKVLEYYGIFGAYHDRLVLCKESVESATTLKEVESIIAEIEQDSENVESSYLKPVIGEYNGLTSIDIRLAQIGEELDKCESQLQSCSDEIDAIITEIVKVVGVESEYIIVYTLNGQPHSVKKDELMSLLKGIYIVNGKKVLIK